MVLVGGIDTVNSPFGYMCFSSAQALSPRGRCSTFDESADGIAISEGLVVLVLKRLEDAERDGDRIYAVIRAVAGSSDGRGKGLTAPRPEGQMRVLERAYAAAGISPATVGLVEAHGTGTVAGDGTEVTALSNVFTAAGAKPGACALGSIKSMIGHTKAAAGVSGLLKVALSLHHKVLPPTLHVTKPNPKLRNSRTPFYVNTEARPWISPAEEPRRGGVSSFGFGGTNFHVVVEEYDSQAAGAIPDSAVMDVWPAELAVWSAASPKELMAALDSVEQAVSRAPNVPLRAVAAAVCRTSAGPPRAGDLRLAIVADSLVDFMKKLRAAQEALKAGRTPLGASENIFDGVVQKAGPSIAFLFPGQGSQYPGMHRELAIHFPHVRHALEMADRVTAGSFPRPLSSYVFPPPAFTKSDEDLRMRELTDTSIAQPALGAVETGLLWLFDRLGIRPSLTGGHSYGEYVALQAAGVFSTETLFTLSMARGQLMKQACGDRTDAMAAVGAAPDLLRSILPADVEVWVANLNTPRQTVLAGTSDAIDKAMAIFAGAGITARLIEVSCAFHSPLVEPAQQQMAALLMRTPIRAPRIPVFSNSLAAAYPEGADDIRQVLANHIVRPVRFVEQIESMYAAGARVFLELGPRSVLTNLARETLAGRDAVVIPLNTRGKPEIPQLLTTLAQLAVFGAQIDFDVLWHGRSIPMVRVSDLAAAAPPAPSPHAWMVSGGEARPPGQRAKPVTAVATASSSSVSAGPSTPARVSDRPAIQRTLADPGQTSPSEKSQRFAVRAAVTPSKTPKIKASNGGFMDPHRLPQLDARTGNHDIVMDQFQQLMSQFLQTQALIMTTYLQGEPSGLPAASSIQSALPAAQPFAALERTSSPDSSEIQIAAESTLRTKPHAPIAFPASAASMSGDRQKPSGVRRLTEAEVLTILVRIVSDRTGYPEEMLAVDANIEADLGIDSIKRMEILATFQEVHGGSERTSFQEALERLTALKTLRESATALAEILAAPAAAAAAV
jgi:acyl transferase domain-containing protein